MGVITNLWKTQWPINTIILFIYIFRIQLIVFWSAFGTFCLSIYLKLKTFDNLLHKWQFFSWVVTPLILKLYGMFIVLKRKKFSLTWFRNKNFVSGSGQFRIHKTVHRNVFKYKFYNHENYNFSLIGLPQYFFPSLVLLAVGDRDIGPTVPSLPRGGKAERFGSLQPRPADPGECGEFSFSLKVTVPRDFHLRFFHQNAPLVLYDMYRKLEKISVFFLEYS